MPHSHHRIQQLAVIGVCLLTAAAHAQVELTFDDDGVVFNSDSINQAYGDRVTASPDGAGLLYNLVGAGAPNVVASYGPSDPSLWTTGYGDLTNVYYNEIDGDTLLQITLTADPGFQVGLLAFDAAVFGGSDTTVPNIEVVDGQGDVLTALGPTLLSAATRSEFDFGAGIFAQEINLNIDLTGLGGASDNIGLDNVLFTQRAIPEPTTIALLGALAAGFAATRRRV